MGHAAAPDEDMDLGATESLIKSVMTDQRREQSRDILPELEPVDADAEADRKSKKRRLPNLAARFQAGPHHGLKDRVLSYRPTRKHVVLAVLAVVMVLRPWLIPGLLLLTFLVALIVWLTVGPDRVTEWAMNRWDKLAQRNPKLAEKLRQRGDAFALRFDAMLDKLPDSWAEKLALPDLSASVKSDPDLEAQPDPFEKLKLPEVYRG